MEVFRTVDGQVAKYIHDDGSETAVKAVSSCNNIVGLKETARNKYSVFVSISSGCPMRCRFCYLTVKKCGYSFLTEDQILNNIKEALAEEVKHNPELKEKYIKVSWMGMGDALLNADIVKYVTVAFLDWVFEKGYAKGLDGVDLSTMYPDSGQALFLPLITLDHKLSKYNYNPDCNDGRSRFRLFYSLHSPDEFTRNRLIPYSTRVKKAVHLMDSVCDTSGIDLIFHQLFLDNVNDSDYHIKALTDFMKGRKTELRVLRYNKCDKAEFEETKKFDEIVNYLSTNIYKLKYQVSTGSEIKAACGQFILKDFRSKGQVAQG